jgi:hypothetical protein
MVARIVAAADHAGAAQRAGASSTRAWLISESRAPAGRAKRTLDARRTGPTLNRRGDAAPGPASGRDGREELLCGVAAVEQVADVGAGAA